MLTGGEGVKNPENVADVICERPLMPLPLSRVLTQPILLCADFGLPSSEYLSLTGQCCGLRAYVATRYGASEDDPRRQDEV